MPDAGSMIEVFPWNENFECGIDLIDTQHKRLVELLNQLVSHLAYQSDAPQLERVFLYLQDYAASHFADEEDIWQTYFQDDPWSTSHHVAHENFVKRIVAMRSEDEGRPYDQVVENIVTFLTHWLALHIIETDKRMAKAVLAIQAGMPIAKAKAKADDDMSGATRVLIDTVMSMYDSLAHRTVQLTREINTRKRAEKDLQEAKQWLEDIQEQTIRREMALRAEYEKLIGDHEAQNKKLREAMESTITALSSTLETRDPYTAGHQRQVADIAVAIARRMGLDGFTIEGLALGCLVHDIGKIQVPLQILSKPTRLNDLEMRLIRLHPEAGWNILKDLDLPWPIADMVRQHHEYLDGSGYPQGLTAGDILLESRIVTVADIVESMSSARPYRPALGIPAALEEINRLKGSKLDADVVDACLAYFAETGQKP
jgi:hemerythrin-like metal-binding protein